MELQLSGLGNSQRRDDPEFSLREWGLKSRMISRDNTISRRFSASHITSFREDNSKYSSFRSNFTISSTASSPGFGYTLKEEIDPSTYSFTNALKALQLRSINTWEYLSPEVGMTLNSKWNEAEKYISNPLSGEVPMECLSAKTLSGRSFKSLTNRITMSAPLIYTSSHSRQFANIPIQEKSKEKGNKKTRDVGTQSTPPEPEFTSSSPSSASTPPIHERSINCNLAVQATTDSSNSSSKSKCHDDVQQEDVKEAGEETKRNEDESSCRKERKANNQNYVCMCKQGGCLSLRNLWTRRRQREKHKPRNKNLFLHQIKGC